MNNEITEELTKRFIEEYGKDEWYAVSQMSYPHLVELCLTLRRQMRWASEGRLWEKGYDSEEDDSSKWYNCAQCDLSLIHI